MKNVLKYLGLALCCAMVAAVVNAQVPIGPLLVRAYALFANDGLRIADTNASHYLHVQPGSDLTADRNLTITTGDAARTLTLSGDATISGTNTGDQTSVTGNAGTATAALGLKTATTTVDVQSATAPTAGQVLTATSSTAATWQAASGGSGATNVLVFRPAAVADTAQVFNDWPSLWAAFQATSGDVDIQLDPEGQGDEYTVTVPAGSYDCEARARIRAYEGTWAAVQWAAGVTLSQCAQFGPYLEVYGSADTNAVMTLPLYNAFTLGSNTGLVATATGPFAEAQGDNFIWMGDWATISGAAGYAVKQTAGGITVLMDGTGNTIQGSYALRAENSGTSITVNAYGGKATVGANSISAVAGSTVNIRHTASSDPSTLTSAQTGILGTLNRTYINYATQLRTAATDKCLARVTASGGAVEEVTCTDAFQSLWDDTTTSDMRTTLGLGTMAVATATDYLAKNSANTMGASGTIDASGQATGTFRIPNVVGAATTTAGALEYNTTQGALVGGGYQSTTGTIPRVLHASVSTSDTITASVVGTAETAFSRTHTIPASYLIANKTLRITYAFQIAGTAGPTWTFRLRAGGVGGTELYRTGSITSTSSSVTRGNGVSLIVGGTAAAGASVNVVTGVTGSSVSASFNCVTIQPVALATNASIELTPTVTWSVSTAGNSVTLLSAIVEEIN